MANEEVKHPVIGPMTLVCPPKLPPPLFGTQEAMAWRLWLNAEKLDRLLAMYKWHLFPSEMRAAVNKLRKDLAGLYDGPERPALERGTDREEMVQAVAVLRSELKRKDIVINKLLDRLRRIADTATKWDTGTSTPQEPSPMSKSE